MWLISPPVEFTPCKISPVEPKYLMTNDRSAAPLNDKAESLQPKDRPHLSPFTKGSVWISVRKDPKKLNEHLKDPFGEPTRLSRRALLWWSGIGTLVGWFNLFPKSFPSFGITSSDLHSWLIPLGLLTIILYFGYRFIVLAWNDMRQWRPIKSFAPDESDLDWDNPGGKRVMEPYSSDRIPEEIRNSFFRLFFFLRNTGIHYRGWHNDGRSKPRLSIPFWNRFELAKQIYRPSGQFNIFIDVVESLPASYYTLVKTARRIRGVEFRLPLFVASIGVIGLILRIIFPEMWPAPPDPMAWPEGFTS